MLANVPATRLQRVARRFDLDPDRFTTVERVSVGGPTQCTLAVTYEGMPGVVVSMNPIEAMALIDISRTIRSYLDSGKSYWGWITSGETEEDWP